MGVRRLGASSHPVPNYCARNVASTAYGVPSLSRTGGGITQQSNLTAPRAIEQARVDGVEVGAMIQPRWLATCRAALPAGPSIWATTESSTVSSTVPPPLSCISFFVTCRSRSAPSRRRCASGAPARAGHRGRACVRTVSDAPRIESQASDGKGPPANVGYRRPHSESDFKFLLVGHHRPHAFEGRWEPRPSIGPDKCLSMIGRTLAATPPVAYIISSVHSSKIFHTSGDGCEQSHLIRSSDDRHPAFELGPGRAPPTQHRYPARSPAPHPTFARPSSRNLPSPQPTSQTTSNGVSQA